MPNEKQDLINHRLTATACKNYTDKEIKKAKDELKTFFSKNIVNTEDHTNELAYQITAPSGAKLLQLQAIGGNSVKYEPSVASDDTTALVKTMPSVVYDFDVNKVKGASEVSENLLVLSDKAETTTNGITYKVENGVLYVSGTATSQTDITLGLNKTLSAGSYYLMIFNWQTNLGIDYFIVNQDYNYDFYNLSDGSSVIKTMTFNGNENLRTLFIRITNGTTISGTLQLKPMLVKGSTAPTEFKVGYEGIHNNELTGFKVEGANLISVQPVKTTIGGSDFIYGGGGTFTDINEILKGTYTFKILATSSASFSLRFRYIDDTEISFDYTSISSYKTFTAEKNINGIRSLVNGSASDIKVMLVRGSTAPSSYVPYISPTTIPIDLTSIVGSSGNKLFEDGSLKGINDVYDEITPYKAVKRFDIVDLGILSWSYDSTYNIFWAGIINISPRTSVLCTNYTSNNVRNDLMNDKEISTVPSYATNMVMIKDSNYTSAEAFKTAMSGVYLVYELATPIEADIDLSQLRNIQGHSNGSITAQNTYDMQVPSEIRYNSIIQDTLCPSVSVEGFNVWDEEWELGTLQNQAGLPQDNNDRIRSKNFNKCLPNTSYYGYYGSNVATSGFLFIYFYDSNYNFIELKDITNNIQPSPDNASYFKIRTNDGYNSYKKDICINISNSEFNGTYKPYKAPITRNLPTITSDGYGVNANVHNLRVFSDYEGNEINKRYTNVSKELIGSLTGGYDSSRPRFYLYTINFKPNNVITMTSSRYTASAGVFDNPATTDLLMGTGADRTTFTTDFAYSDFTTYKNANADVALYGELKDTSKTETDLDSFDYFFDVEEGDTITFNNPYAQQVYATYSFIIKEVKSNE